MTTIDPIWAVNAGDVFQARTNIWMEDGPPEQVFTAGKSYRVLRVLPLLDPAAAVVIDDSGTENKIEASFLGNFIHLPREARCL